MKKQLIVMRHAKTEVQKNGQTDFERSLTERGIGDAKRMGGNILLHTRKTPQLIVASNALRTRQTAKIVAETWELSHENIQTEQALYLCGVTTIENKILSLPDDAHTCLLIGHNPGISEFIYDLQIGIHSTMPTAAYAIINADCTDWNDFFSVSKKLAYYDYPKNNI